MRRTPRVLKPRSSGKRTCLVWLAGGVAILCCVGVVVWVWLTYDLPAPDDLTDYTSIPSSKIFDRSGRLLYQMPSPRGGFHTPVAFEEIPLVLRQATIAVEDADFYRHAGIDLSGIARALWADLSSGKIVMGGSTITQQLARSLLLSPSERVEQTIVRKIREAVLAIRLTRRYSKDEILTFYLNEVYYGNMAYGVEAGAHAVFGKSVRDLDLAECALLAGLPQAPAVYNPLLDPAAALARQAVVLERMTAEGYISPDEAVLARQERLDFGATPFEIRAPHFVMYVRAQLERELGRERLETGGLRIYTTLDAALNEAIADVLRHQLELLAMCEGKAQDCPPGGHNAANGAVMVLDPQTGEIRAMVGSPDYFSARIDGAVNAALALRQPGSSIKPLVYAAAFEEGILTPASMLLDIRMAFPTAEGLPYVPMNYDRLFRGPVRVREALAASYNVPAVEALERTGLASFSALARRLGISSLDRVSQLGLAAALGGGEVCLLEETVAFAAFANGGVHVEPVAVQRVEDAEGRVLWASASRRGDQVLDPRVAFLITDILSDDLARAPTFGEGSVLALSRPAAVKTGTTTDFRDNWAVGYTPDVVVGVWIGNADGSPMLHVTGVSGAGPVWHTVMELALQGHSVLPFTPPAGLSRIEVCALSGQLRGADCPHGITEWFIEGTEPESVCDMHQRTADGVVVNYPAAAQAWAREQGLLEVAAEPIHSAVGEVYLGLLRPDDGAVFRRDSTVAQSAQRIRISAAVAPVLREVTLWVDGAPLAVFQAPPYAVYWVLEMGQHRFWVTAVTPEGVEVSGEVVTITVE